MEKFRISSENVEFLQGSQRMYKKNGEISFRNLQFYKKVSNIVRLKKKKEFNSFIRKSSQFLQKNLEFL